MSWTIIYPVRYFFTIYFHNYSFLFTPIISYCLKLVKLVACCLKLEAWALTLALRAVKQVEAGVLYFNSLGDRPTSN